MENNELEYIVSLSGNIAGLPYACLLGTNGAFVQGNVDGALRDFLQNSLITLLSQHINEGGVVEVNEVDKHPIFAPHLPPGSNLKYIAAVPLRGEYSITLGFLILMGNSPHSLSQVQQESLAMLTQMALTRLNAPVKPGSSGIKRLLEKKFARLSYYYKAFLNATDYAVIFTDTAGIIKVFNQGAERMLGCTTEEVTDVYYFPVFHEAAELSARDINITGGFGAYATRMMQLTGQEIEWRMFRGDNSAFYSQLSFKPITNEQKETIGYLIIIQDISQRKQMEQDLRMSEEKHRVFFENSQAIMFTHSPGGEILSVNEVGAKMIGYEPRQLIGKNINDFIPLALRRHVNEYLLTINHKGSATGLAKINLDSDKHRTLYYRNVKVGAPGFEYIICNAIDVSARMELERNLTRAKLFAEKTSQAKDQFMANMSHEIRTPMNAIIGFNELLAQTSLSEEQRENVEAIKLAGENLMGIVNDILDFSKIESGKLALENIPFDLAAVVRNIGNIFRLKAAQKGIDLKLTLPATLPAMLMGDGLRINQVLLNLVSNAIKFTESGRVELELALLTNDNDSQLCHVRFSVKDTGIGISEEQAGAIFERFTQASSETTRKYGGTGLGLSISRNLVEMMGGTLQVKSREGLGAEFWFELAFEVSQQQKSEKEGQEKRNGSSTGKKLKILLAEDNELNRKLARRVLEGFGFEARVAEDGQAAVEALKREDFDLVLMDLQMPVMDGYQATRLIRQTLKLNLPIMAMTAHSLPGEKEKCLEAGMNDYITKPFKSGDLLYKINKHAVGIATENTAMDHASQPLIPQQEPSLERLRELSGGNVEFEMEIINLFIRNTPLEITAGYEALKNKDLGKLKKTGHKLKSSALTFNLSELASALARLEYNTTDFEMAGHQWKAVEYGINQAIEKLGALTQNTVGKSNK